MVIIFSTKWQFQSTVVTFHETNKFRWGEKKREEFL